MDDNPRKEERIFWSVILFGVMFLLNLFLKTVLFAFEVDACNGTGGNPSLRICNDVWLFANVLIEFIILVVLLRFTLFHELRFVYRAALFTVYCVYVVLSLVLMYFVWQLPFFWVQIGSEADGCFLAENSESDFNN